MYVTMAGSSAIGVRTGAIVKFYQLRLCLMCSTNSTNMRNWLCIWNQVLHAQVKIAPAQTHLAHCPSHLAAVHSLSLSLASWLAE